MSTESKAADNSGDMIDRWGLLFLDGCPVDRLRAKFSVGSPQNPAKFGTIPVFMII